MRRQSAALRHARCTQECAQRSLSPSRAHSSNAGLERFPHATADARRAAHLGPAAVDSDVHANRRHPRARAAPRHPRNPHPNASPRRRATRAACAQAPHPPAAQAAFALRLICKPCNVHIVTLFLTLTQDARLQLDGVLALRRGSRRRPRHPPRAGRAQTRKDSGGNRAHDIIQSTSASRTARRRARAHARGTMPPPYPLKCQGSTSAAARAPH